MANNTEFTASSKERIDNEFESLWKKATGYANPYSYSAVTYNPAE